VLFRSHDFNNILGAIQIYADLALMKTGNGQAADAELRQVVAATDRAAGLARQLLLFSRKQPLDMVPVDPVRLVEDLLKMLRRIIGEHIEVCTELDAGGWRVVGDNGGIEQIVMNLAVNARDAMPDGGRLAIRVRQAQVDEEAARCVLGARCGSFVCVSVEDNGCGIALQTQQRIFEPFFTTKGEGKGTGLGLSVVYGIVQQHRGWITVKSTVGVGTRFEVFLPGGPEVCAGAGQVAPELAQLRGGGELLLLVEDEDGYRVVTAEALLANGYEVDAVCGVAEAERRVREHSGRYRLVFADVALGDGNGYDLALRLRALVPDLPVLLTSGYTDETSQLARIRAAGFPFIAKPFALAALLIAIRGLLRQPPR
jgi:CheY-like chemotaxis protein